MVVIVKYWSGASLSSASADSQSAVRMRHEEVHPQRDGRQRKHQRAMCSSHWLPPLVLACIASIVGLFTTQDVTVSSAMSSLRER